METLRPAVLLMLFLGGCAPERVESQTPAPPQQPSSEAARDGAQTSKQTSEPAGDAVNGVWAGQVKIDAHAGVANLNYVGAESGDFVPMRFSTDSEVGAKILAECADEDLCEFEGAVQFLDEPPPDNASAVGQIVRVDRVKKLQPDQR